MLGIQSNLLLLHDLIATGLFFWCGEVLKNMISRLGVRLMGWRITLMHRHIFNLHTNRELAEKEFWSG